VTSPVAALVAGALALAGCGGVTLLEIVGEDRPVPRGADAICVGVADTSPGGGHYGQLYRLDEPRRDLPQTLRIEAGGADAAFAWVRADRGGVPVARAQAAVDFGADKVTLDLGRCVHGPAGAPAVQGTAAGPAGARLVASAGAGGTVVVAVAAGEAAVLDARTGALVASAAPAPPGGAISAVVAIDIDGDCDDDVVVATTGAPPAIWRRDGTAFTAVGELGTAPVAALAAGDTNRDRRIDLITGVGATLALWRNAGGGVFEHIPEALSGGTRVTAIRALALGDVFPDGNPDLIVGQANGPLQAWLGDPGGTGTFAPAPAVIPPIALDVASLALADIDNDAAFGPDLAVALEGQPLRIYIDREGSLEDRSHVVLMDPLPTVHAIAVGGWDPDCEPDVVMAGDAESPMFRGQPSGTLALDAGAPGATDVVMADLDDDGDLDAILATPEGVLWLAR
jgi:hypothetical protein